MGQGAWLVVAAGAAFLTDFGAAQVKISRESAIQLSSVMSAHDFASSLHLLGCSASYPTLQLHLFGFLAAVTCQFVLTFSWWRVDSRSPFHGAMSIHACPFGAAHRLHSLFLEAPRFMFSFL